MNPAPQPALRCSILPETLLLCRRMSYGKGWGGFAASWASAGPPFPGWTVRNPSGAPHRRLFLFLGVAIEASAETSGALPVRLAFGPPWAILSLAKDRHRMRWASQANGSQMRRRLKIIVPLIVVLALAAVVGSGVAIRNSAQGRTFSDVSTIPYLSLIHI